MTDLANMEAVVVGAGASGLAAARLLLKQGARVMINDVRTRAELGEPARLLEQRGVILALGSHDEAVFEGADLVVVSPGVPPFAALDTVRAQGVEVVGEVELAARVLTGELVGITGTNGKSTVTSLVGAALEHSGFPTFVGGNLGVALSDAVGGPADVDGGKIVVELSSFQLEAVSRFRPKVAALLNLSPDHLDRYADLEAYGRAKANVFGAQGEGDHAVLPADDAAVDPFVPDPPVEVHRFGGAGGEIRLEGEHLVDRDTGWRFAVSDMQLRGRHNAVNGCAAALIAKLAGASVEGTERALRELRGLPHRAAFVRALDGVDYVDDSKATNVGAAVAALDGLASETRRAVLIAGGVDKGGSYAPLKERLERVGRAVVLIGEATPIIEQALAGLTTVRAETLEDAVLRARELAEPGDVVLLAPACSSYDMFNSYAQRGDAFVAAVQSLEGGALGGDA